MTPIFITGIGTGVGKTLISAILTEAFHLDYWKPVQAGYLDGTDSKWMKTMITNNQSTIRPELYIFKLAASPHIASKQEGIEISIQNIVDEYVRLINTSLHSNSAGMLIEGAGGIMVPLNENEFVIDLIEKLNAKVILVSRNYLGSINHSLLTAEICKQRKINVLGWIFNDQYLDYEDEISYWSGYRKLASLPKFEIVNKETVAKEAMRIKNILDLTI